MPSSGQPNQQRPYFHVIIKSRQSKYSKKDENIFKYFTFGCTYAKFAVYILRAKRKNSKKISAKKKLGIIFERRRNLHDK